MSTTTLERTSVLDQAAEIADRAGNSTPPAYEPVIGNGPRVTAREFAAKRQTRG